MGGTNEEPNLIYLTEREHYICHWLLAKSFGGGMWFAFNQMQRVIQGEKKTSLLYEYARKYISNQISLSNTGRSMSVENRALMSKRMRGMVWVKHRDDPDDILLMSNLDDRYLYKEYIPIQTGNKRGEIARQNLQNSNGIRGKFQCYNPKTSKVKYIGDLSELPTGWIVGLPPNIKGKISSSVKKLRFYHDPISGKSFRLNENQDTSSLIKGRLNGFSNGLQTMNSLDCIKVYDLSLKKRVLIKSYQITRVQLNVPNNGYLVVFENFIFDSVHTFNTLLPEFPTLAQRTLDSKFLPHFNMSSERNSFCKKYEGMSYSKLGIRLVRVDEFVGNVDGSIIIKKGGNENGNSLNDFRSAFNEKTRTRS
jgi:hypothetical protein